MKSELPFLMEGVQGNVRLLSYGSKGNMSKDWGKPCYEHFRDRAVDWMEPPKSGVTRHCGHAVFFTLAMFSCTETPCDELLASVEENSVLVKSIRTSTWGHHCSTLYQPRMSSFVFAEAWLQKQNILWVCARQRKWENSHKLCRCYCYFINEKMEAQKDTSDLVQTDTSVTLRHKACTFRFWDLLSFYPVL